MTKTFIFGHKNPDTDAISSALIMADFEQQTGNTEAKAYRLGEISAETQFALDYFNVEAPELLNEDLKGQDVILVDHNEFQQSADTISNATIKHVIDHHRISNFETAGLYTIEQNQLVVVQQFYIKCIKNVDLKLNQKSLDL